MLDKPIFLLTVPKSGTHLLANQMRAILGAEKVYYTLIDPDSVEKNHASLEPMVYIGHLPHSLEMAARLRPYPIALLYRDPRDVVVSLCSSLYHGKHTPDPLREFINANIPYGEALSFLILGGEFKSIRYEDILTFFSRYCLKWLGQAVATVRYEDLLPADGNWDVPVRTVRNLLSVLGIPFEEELLEQQIRQGSDPARSATFHKGVPGQWGEFFSPQHLLQFKAVASSLLTALGYEENENWGARGPGPAPAEGSATAGRFVQREAPGPGLAGIRGQLESISGILAQLRNRNDYMHNKISFLQIPQYDLGFLCYTNDLMHQQLNQTFCNHAEYANYVAEGRLHPDPHFIQEAYGAPGCQPVCDIVRPRLAAKGKVCFLDIGCQYGLESIVLSSLLWDFRDRLRIVAVDPGPAGKLAPYNIAINGHEGRIEFVPLAVASHCKPSLVYGEYGYLENVRTVNRMVDTETFSYPSESVTVDALVERLGIEEEVVIKLEIAGGEAEALRGARRTLERQCAALLLKFIPHALAPTIEPSEILSLVPRVREVYRLGYYSPALEQPLRPVPIRPDQMKEVTQELWNAKEDYCYLLVIPDQ